jgi:hypothetical protein
MINHAYKSTPRAITNQNSCTAEGYWPIRTLLADWDTWTNHKTYNREAAAAAEGIVLNGRTSA